MNFLRLKPTDPLYQQVFSGADVRGYEVYTEKNESIGKIVDVLVDTAKRSYFLVVDVGSWLSQKRVMVLLPEFHIVESKRAVHVTGLGHEQVKNLPVYDSSNVSDYQTVNQQRTEVKTIVPAPVAPKLELPLETSTPLEASPPLETTVRAVSTMGYQAVPAQTVPPQAIPAQAVLSQDSVASSHRPAPMPRISQTEAALPQAATPLAEETVRLLQERLVIDRKKRKVGEVIVRKAVETRMVEVPIRHETLIVEQISPERKQLASIDLHEGTLAELGLDLREPTPIASSGSSYSADNIPAVSIQRANQVLNRLLQTPQFREGQVKMVFTNPDLQAQYQKWLQEQGHPSI